MYAEFTQPVSPQPQLFLLEESSGTIELFPAVWGALEDLTKEDVNVRRSALEELIELDAARFSPVVSYILVTKVVEPNSAPVIPNVQGRGTSPVRSTIKSLDDIKKRYSELSQQ